jgi:subtilisin family serine protease
MDYKRTAIYSLITALILFTFLIPPTAYSSNDNLLRKIVVFKSDFKNENAQKALLKVYEAKTIRSLKIINAASVVIPEQRLNNLYISDKILRIDDDIKIFINKKPPWAGGDEVSTDPVQILPWGVDRIDSESVWTTTTGKNIKTAVLDTGIDKSHNDLNVTAGINFVGKSPAKAPDPQKWDDDNGHGTHVAGIIGALNNNIGVVGVAPETELYAIKSLDRNGSGYLSNIIAGLGWAVENNIHILNMSLGTNSDIQSFKDACDNAKDMGIILVAAAGNDGGDVDYPAAYESVIAVAALDIDDNKAGFSSLGNEIVVSAPGVSIYSTYKDNSYASLSGTSMAAPHVAGALALKLSFDYPVIKDFQTYKDLLIDTADDINQIGFDIETGYGIVDAEELSTGYEAGNNLSN